MKNDKKNLKEHNIKRLNETVELMDYNIEDEKELVNILSKVLIEGNITPMYKGYNYIIDGIRILYRNKYNHILITKDIYRTVAGLYETTPELVEHGIRTAIKKGWMKTTDIELKSKLYNSVEKSPTNYAFLASAASYAEDRILREHKGEIVR